MRGLAATLSVSTRRCCLLWAAVMLAVAILMAPAVATAARHPERPTPLASELSTEARWIRDGKSQTLRARGTRRRCWPTERVLVVGGVPRAGEQGDRVRSCTTRRPAPGR